ncbi:MAG: hypothetical protein WCE50_13240 [Candidatus Acidiferrum sp.]
MILDISIEKGEQFYTVVGPGTIRKVLGTLRELELWVRVNFQVIPEEWAKLNAKLNNIGKATVEMNAGKFSQVI